MPNFQQFLQAQASFESQILAKPNVVGVAVGLKEHEGQWTDTMALVVLVQQKLPLTALSAADRVPREIDGIQTDVYEVGVLRAQQLLPPTSRFRDTWRIRMRPSRAPTSSCCLPTPKACPRC